MPGGGCIAIPGLEFVSWEPVKSFLKSRTCTTGVVTFSPLTWVLQYRLPYVSIYNSCTQKPGIFFFLLHVFCRNWEFVTLSISVLACLWCMGTFISNHHYIWHHQIYNTMIILKNGSMQSRNKKLTALCILEVRAQLLLTYFKSFLSQTHTVFFLCVKRSERVVVCGRWGDKSSEPSSYTGREIYFTLEWTRVFVKTN